MLVGAVLLGTCRFILRSQPDNAIVFRLAMQYQQSSLQALMQTLDGDATRVSALAVAKAIALVVDAVR